MRKVSSPSRSALRSAAWYADSGHAASRKAKMRAYTHALTELGRRYQDERRWLYRQARENGDSRNLSESRARLGLKSKYPGEFAAIYEEKQSAEQSA